MGINVKDIFTIRYYIDNHYDGFTSSLEELENDKKIEFIMHCQFLIENDWSDEFKEKFESGATHDFFNIIKPLMVEPLGAEGIFQNRKDISLQSAPIINYFTKLYLFRLTYEVCRDNQDLLNEIGVDVRWFRETNNNLHKKFADLAAEFTLKYDRNNLVNFEDFARAVVTRNQFAIQRNTYIKLPLLLLIASTFLASHICKRDNIKSVLCIFGSNNSNLCSIKSGKTLYQ